MNPKIALVCTGLGSIWRGYERFTRELFDLVKDDLNITLFKGAGPANARERKFFHLTHDGILSKITRNARFYQPLSYAVSLLPHLMLNRYDIVHYSEPELGNILFRAKKKFRLRYKMLFSNGVGLYPEHCARFDHIHQLTPAFFREAARRGIPEAKMTCLPYGLHTNRFSLQQSRERLREKHAIPLDKTVILSVAALNRSHKRMDYLIRETARLDGRFFLLACGHLEDPTLAHMAQELLPGRHKFMTVAFQEIPELYHLSDLFVHTALEEGFCLAVVEALCAGLPTAVHQSPHFEWLTGSKEWLLDLSRPGLAERISEMAARLPEMKAAALNVRPSILRRFDWNHLKQDYLAMYEKLV